MCWFFFFVFFVKQKSAYELLISVWSSDVCSSDLLLKCHYFSIAGLCFLLFLTSNTSGILAFYFSEVNTFLSIFMALLFVILYFGTQLTLFKYVEIGRASCRERVCQYV